MMISLFAQFGAVIRPIGSLRNMTSTAANSTSIGNQALGCSYEQATGHYLSVDIPPKVDIYQAYGLFQAGESAGAWELEEGHCGHPLRG